MTSESLRSICLSILRANAEHSFGFGVADPTPPRSTPFDISELLSNEEQELLNLYDRYTQLRLERQALENEIGMLREAGSGGTDHMDVDAENETEELKALKEKLTTAKAKVLLKDKVVDHVLVTRPILRAVHSGRNSLQHERELLPYLRTRDLLSSQLLQLHETRKDVQNQTRAARVHLIHQADENKELATRMKELEVLDEMRNSVRTEMTIEKEVQLRHARMRWDTIRGVVSGVIVGSGVDWGRDEKLAEVVWDCGGDD